MQILNTKFHIPQIADNSIILRKKLFDSITHEFKNRLLLVCAPAGFGKTTFLSQWVSRQNYQKNTAWLSLDEKDNHLLKFWSYVVEAIHKKIPDICAHILELIRCPSNEPFENIIVKLVNCLDHLHTPMVLVLDDFHVITDADILNSFNFLIDHPVKGLVIVISTRKTPDLGLSRLRLTGALKEIQQTDLAFSVEETRQFMIASGETVLPADITKLLNSRTEGWIAGIKLAMISMKGRGDKDRFIADFKGNNRYILDYLVEEVLMRLPEETRDFMLRISILPRFNGFLCSKLTGNRNSFESLKYIEQHNLFLVPLDDQREWFRYHHLFRDCLKKILEQEKKEELSELYANALQWFEQNGYSEEAFHIAVESKNIKTAANILSGIIPEIFSSGGEQFILPFFKYLNKNAILSNPVLACYHTWIVVINGNFDAISDLETLLNTTTLSREDEELIRGFYDLFQGYALFYMQGDLVLSMEKCKNALILIPQIHYGIRRMAEHMLSIYYRFAGDLESAIAISRERKEDNLFMSVLAVMNTADQEIELGNLSRAHDIVKRKLDESVASFHEDMPMFFGFIYAAMGIVLREQNRLDEAAMMFSKGVPLCRKSGFLEMIPVAYMEHARLYAAQREFDNAHKTIDLAIDISSKSSFWALGSMKAWKGRFYLMEGKTEYPKKFAAQFRIKRGMQIPFIQSLEYLFLVRYFIYIRKDEKALLVLDIMINEDIENKRNGRLLECLILKAKLLFLQNNLDDAMVYLEKAFDIARDQGHVRLFLDEYPSMRDLFHKARQKEVVPKYLHQWLVTDNWDKVGGSEENKKISVIIHGYEEQFNSREVEILRFISQGNSNREIADKLYLSVNTVRWYARQIFSKLDVNTRGKAASKAVQLGLIFK